VIKAYRLLQTFSQLRILRFSLSDLLDSYCFLNLSLIYLTLTASLMDYITLIDEGIKTKQRTWVPTLVGDERAEASPVFLQVEVG